MAINGYNDDMKIVQLASDFAAEAAQLHIAGQPDTFLTRLGPDVLTVLYRALPQSPVGFGYAAIGDHSIDEPDSPQSPIQNRSPADLGGLRQAQAPLGEPVEPSRVAHARPKPKIVLGFVSATTSVGRLFAEMGTRRIGEFLPPLLARFAHQPALILRSVQTVLYPFLGHSQQANATGSSAELLSIMVDPAARSQGIGAQLMNALLCECIQRQIEWLDVTVDVNNAGARRFYECHDFALAHKFTLYGREMCGYKRAIGNRNAAGIRHER